MNTRWVMGAGLCMMMAAQVAMCCVTYEPGAGITSVTVTAPTDGSSVAAGATITASCTTATDTDVRKCTGEPDQNVTDPVTHTWSGSGSYSPGVGTGVNWTAPTAAGNATITVTADDSPLANEQPTTKSVTVKVVKVSKIQYNDPDSGYVDVPGTLYVMKDTTVTFKAVKDPADAAWPGGKPVWAGTAGASGTGETKGVAFDATGDKTVTAECGNTVTVNVKVYELTGHHVAQDNFDGRATTDYGVKEIANLAFLTDPEYISGAEMGGLSWSLTAGSGSVSNSGTSGTGIYTAPVAASTVTLTLTVLSGPSKDRHVDMGFAVVAPSGTRMTRVNTKVWHVKSTASAGIQTYYWLDPKTVSFKNVDFAEGSCVATNVSGFYQTCAPWNSYPTGGSMPDHLPSYFGAIGPGNSTTGCMVEHTDDANTGGQSPTLQGASLGLFRRAMSVLETITPSEAHRVKREPFRRMGALR